MLVIFNLGSYGLGVLLIGAISDYLATWFGNRAIAYGMFIASLFSMIGLMFVLHSMSLIRDKKLPSGIGHVRAAESV
jgi:uncharacterized membrane protein (DUF4010 family)